MSDISKQSKRYNYTTNLISHFLNLFCSQVISQLKKGVLQCRPSIQRRHALAQLMEGMEVDV
jgi:hypothetical protein